MNENITISPQQLLQHFPVDYEEGGWRGGEDYRPFVKCECGWDGYDPGQWVTHIAQVASDAAADEEQADRYEREDNR